MSDDYSLSDIPNREREVLISTMRLNVNELFHMVKDRRMTYVRNSERRRIQQRDYWTPRQMSELVESVLLGFPIPPFYVFEMKYGDWRVAEGHSRMEALVDYINGLFPLQGLKILGHLNGCYVTVLGSSDRRRLLDAELHFHVIRSDMHPAFQFEIMRRLNHNWPYLSTQELRNLTGSKESNYFLAELAEEPHFRQMLHLKHAHVQNQEAVLRYLAFRHWGYKRYREDIHLFLNRFYHEQLPELVMRDQAKIAFAKEMHALYDMLGASWIVRFSRVRSRDIKLMFFELMSVLFETACHLNTLVERGQDILECLHELYDKNDEFRRAFNHEPWNEQQVHIRFDTWIRAVERVLRG